MTSLILLAAVILLVAFPAIARHNEIALSPQDWARVTLWTTVSALILLEAAAIICALPLLPNSRTTHFFPGGDIAGFISLGIALGIPARIGHVVFQSRSTRRTLRAEPWLGTHAHLEGQEVVVLDSERQLAIAIPGRPAQIVISRATFERLDREQLGLVLRHERCHLRNHHAGFLVVAAAFGPVLRWMPILRDPLDRLPTWLERWADDDSARTVAERRRVHRLLERLTTTDFGAAAVSMSPVDAMVERLDALEEAPHPSETRARLGVAAGAALLVVVGVAPIVTRLL